MGLFDLFKKKNIQEEVKELTDNERVNSIIESFNYTYSGYAITNKYDYFGQMDHRGSFADGNTLVERLFNQITTIISDLQLQQEVINGLMYYEMGAYEKALLIFQKSILAFPETKNQLEVFMKICVNVIKKSGYKENIINVDSFGKQPLTGKNIRCKWCGTTIKYIDPNQSIYGFMPQNNSCSSCKRSYPMPSIMWDSVEGLAYSYYRGSFPEVKFYKDYETDFNPNPKTTKKV